MGGMGLEVRTPARRRVMPGVGTSIFLMAVYLSGQGATPGQPWSLLSVLPTSTTMRPSALSGRKNYHCTFTVVKGRGGL